MNITLGKEFERRIAEKVSEGLYTSSSENTIMTPPTFSELTVLSFKTDNSAESRSARQPF